MTRPRWHDVAIVASIVGVLIVGVWALWWDDVRRAMGWGPSEAPAALAPPPAATTGT
jgi:hypothetical protein